MLKRVLRRLARWRPDAATHAALQLRIDELTAALAERDAATAASGETAHAISAAMKGVIDRAGTSPLTPMRKAVGSLNASLRRQAREARSLPANRQSPAHVNTARVLRRLARLTRDDRPILVGPWTGDVATELVYWVPFVRWFASHFRVPHSRLHVVRRAGAPWYSDLASAATDILSLYPVAEYHARTSGKRATAFAAFEREVARRVARDLARDGGERVATLHPAYMCQLFAPFWAGDGALDDVLRHTLPKHQPPPLATMPLPPHFFAMQAAFSPAFPDTATNRAWLDQAVRTLARHHEVVWLGPDVAQPASASGQYLPPADVRVHQPVGQDIGTSTLTVQSAIVARAEAFVGSCGGMSFVAPFYGVRSLSFFSERAVSRPDRRITDHVLGARGKPALTFIDTAETALLASLLNADHSSAPRTSF